MQAEFIKPNCERWNKCLAQMPHDCYHLPKYVQICADNDGGEAVAFVAEEGDFRLFVPLLVRPIGLGKEESAEQYDAVSPYGYPSPLLKSPENGQRETQFLDDALELLMAGLREREAVSAFVRFHPLLPLPFEPFRRSGAVVCHGETVYLDLTQSEEELWHQTRPRCRSKINRAKRIGYTAVIDDRWDYLDEFIEIYNATMLRVHAQDFYFFSRQYFQDLKEALQGVLHLCLVRFNGTIVTAGLFSEVCGIVQYHLSGMRAEFGHDQPTTFMMDYVRNWARQRGNRQLHLGGGLGAERDSLFQFKSGLSKCRSQYFTWRTVIDPRAYQELVSERASQVVADDSEDKGFFPKYRAPLQCRAESGPGVSS
jgi:hypothetical protein